MLCTLLVWPATYSLSYFSSGYLILYGLIQIKFMQTLLQSHWHWGQCWSLKHVYGLYMGFFAELQLVLWKNMDCVLETVWFTDEGYHFWMLVLWVASELSSYCVRPCSYSPSLILKQRNSEWFRSCFLGGFLPLTYCAQRWTGLRNNSMEVPVKFALSYE